MISVTISMVLLVVFVSQVSGQNTTMVVTSPIPTSAIPPQTSNIESTTTMSAMVPIIQTSTNVPPSQATSPVGPPSSSTIATFSSASVTPAPKQPTCVKLGVTLDLPWDKDHENNSSVLHQNRSEAFTTELKTLYKNPEKYEDVEVSAVSFKDKENKLFVEVMLCLVFIGDEGSIVVVFRDKVDTGKLGDMAVIKGTAEFEPQGVSLTEWKAKKGECEDKCGTAGGPIEIVRECKPDGYSCKGQETSKETKDCTEYCSSTVAVTVSSVILAIGIFLSSSFQ